MEHTGGAGLRLRMYVGATTADNRAEWIAALDKLAALNPAAVVTGHKDPTRGNPPSVLAESRGYLEYYGQLREAALPDRELFDAMVTHYPDWVSRQQWLIIGLGQGRNGIDHPHREAGDGTVSLVCSSTSAEISTGILR
jgi:hypothetical protein